MKQALAPVAALLLGVSILLTGQGLQGTLLPLRAALEEFPTVSIGVMGAAYFLGFTLGCLRGGRLVRRVGHVRVFLAMTALGSAAPLVHGLFVNPVGWALLRMISGFCFAVLYVVIESWLNESSTNDTRGAVFSLYAMISLTVLAAGQMMTLLYDPLDFQLFAIASVLVSLGALPVALSTSPSPNIPESVKLDLGKLFRISPAATLGCLATGLTNGAFWSLAPVFAITVGGDRSLPAWFMTASVIGGAVLQWPLGYLSDRIGRRKVIVVSAVIGAGVSAVLVGSFDNLYFTTACIAGLMWGSVAFPLYAIAVAHANDFADTDDYVMISSGLLLMYGLGAIAGPFLASTIMTWTNAAGLYLFTGVVHLLLVAFVSYRMLKRESAPAATHTAFGDALATAVTASQVYEEAIHQQIDKRE
jgi:MFS family permease